MAPLHPHGGEHNPADAAAAMRFHGVPARDAAPAERLSDQRAMDLVDEACMESFPCSDPPSYTRCHA